MPDLKLIALDSEDLDVISATTQDAVDTGQMIQASSALGLLETSLLEIAGRCPVKRTLTSELRALTTMGPEQLMTAARDLQAPYTLVGFSFGATQALTGATLEGIVGSAGRCGPAHHAVRQPRPGTVRPPTAGHRGGTPGAAAPRQRHPQRVDPGPQHGEQRG